MRITLLALLLFGLALSGCSSKDSPDDAAGPASSTPSVPTPTNSTAGPGIAPPTPDTAFNGSFDLTVTYASAVAGGGTNFGQANCIEFEPVTMANGTATLTWTAGPGSDQLELVIRNFQNANNAKRLVGPSPLTIPFQFALGQSTIIFSVQSPPTGAVTQVPVHLEIGFLHPADEAPSSSPRLCAF
jgi:hypothetical protein